MIRTVGDNNLLISGPLWSGPSKRVLAAAVAGQFPLLTSEALLAELRDALSDPKLRLRLVASSTGVEELLETVRSFSTVVVPAAVVAPQMRDPKDLPVLAAAVGGGAGLIATRDKDLLVLKEFQGIGIVTPVELLHTLGLD